MKSIILFACASLTMAVNAQSPDPNSAVTKKWTPGSIGIGLYTNWDVYSSMSLDQMYDHAANPEDIKLDLNGYTESITKSVTGVGIGGNFSFRLNGNPNRELILGASVIAGREAMINYDKEANFNADTLERQSITYCNLNNEWNVSAAYLIKKGNRFKVFTGLSADLGGTFGKQMVLMYGKTRYLEDYSYHESVEWKDNEFYKADPSMYVRARIPLGMSYTILNAIEINLSTQIGVGAQKVMGGKTHFMSNTGAVMLGVKYHLSPLN